MQLSPVHKSHFVNWRLSWSRNETRTIYYAQHLSLLLPPTETSSLISCCFHFRFPLGIPARWRICFSSSDGNGCRSYAARIVRVWKSVQLVWMATIPPTIRIHNVCVLVHKLLWIQCWRSLTINESLGCLLIRETYTLTLLMYLWPNKFMILNKLTF